MAEAEVIIKKKAGIFYGYWIVVAAFIIFFINSGCSFYSFGLFVSPLEKALGWSRSGIMLANTTLNLAQGFGSLFVGRIIGRFGMKWVLVLGTTIVTLCFIGILNMSELWQFYLLYGIAGLGCRHVHLRYCGDLFNPEAEIVYRFRRSMPPSFSRVK